MVNNMGPRRARQHPDQEDFPELSRRRPEDEKSVVGVSYDDGFV